jgi:hypothetical protein
MEREVDHKYRELEQHVAMMIVRHKNARLLYEWDQLRHWLDVKNTPTEVQCNCECIGE